ncbi:MAG TPA: DUF1566 domain-containing protein [Dissulfurispiraceae bacterium]|nr:DUF1566 domain-containing protein [Dissulfurispiraceae bacterium]
MKKLPGNLSAAVLILLLIHSVACAFNLPDTGQTLCYNTYEQVISCAGTGQDGEFSIHPLSLSYTDNGDYTVTDNNTGLMWEKCTIGQTNNPTPCSGTGTIYYPGNPDPTVCSSRTTGGYGGWRTPSKKELITIVDYSVPSPGPAIMASYFPNTQEGFYCSSTTYVGAPASGWFIDFSSGGVYNGSYQGDSCWLRCVRDVQPPPPQSFHDNSDLTVTDQKTGLMWQKCSAGQTNNDCSGGTAMLYTWTDALSYCNNFVLPSSGGYADWRLPNIKELESITDDTKSTRIDPAIFPHTQSSSYRTSTTAVSGGQEWGYAWGLDFNYGSVNNLSEVNGSFYVRCVRGLGYFVRLLHGTGVNPYTTFLDAYSAALDGDTIEAQTVVSTENVTCDSTSGIHVWLKGGYDSGFTSNTGFTTIGSLTISGGSVTIENLIIQ